jgi:hypothetical protein
VTVSVTSHTTSVRSRPRLGTVISLRPFLVLVSFSVQFRAAGVRSSLCASVAKFGPVSVTLGSSSTLRLCEESSVVRF